MEFKKISMTSLLVIALTFLFNLTAIAGDLETLREEHFNVNSGQSLNIKTSVGDIKIERGDGNKVFVKVLGNSKAREKMKFDFKQTGQGVNVEGKKNGNEWFEFGHGIHLKYEIMVPGNFNIDVNTSGGDAYVKGIKGKISLNTSGGDLTLIKSKGDIVMNTSGGDILVNDVNGGLKLSTSGGDINCSNADGNIDAETSGGNIMLDASNGKVAASTSGGDVSLNYSGQNYGIELESTGGDISLKLPHDFKADVYFKTSGGDVELNFSNNSAASFAKNRFEGTFNGGGKKINCETSGGDIVITSF